MNTRPVSRHFCRLAISLLALTALTATGTAAAAKAPARHSSAPARCKKGAAEVRGHARRKAARGCKKQPAKAKTPAPSPAPSSAPASASSDPAAPAPAPAPVGPTAPPVVTTGATEVHALIGAGFSQNPLAPNEVTWHYSAAATRTVTTDGQEQSETVPLPEGRLVFYVDGHLDCEIKAGGAIAGSTCTAVLPSLGAHEVSAIFSAGELSDVATRTDLIGRFPTSTSLQVSVEPVAPELIDIGPNAAGFPQEAFEVGRLRISGGSNTGLFPVFDCEGQGVGCLEPEAPGLKARNGTTSVPLYAQWRRNAVTEREEWHVGFPASSPALRESNWFWQFPQEAVGTRYLRAVTEPDASRYEPSSAVVPLDLRGGHYPFHREWKEGELAPAAAVEGTMQRAWVLGTYEKLQGPEASIPFHGVFHPTAAESENCLYQPRVDGQGLNERRDLSYQSIEFYNGFFKQPAGVHTLEVWIERKKGAGPGSCGLGRGYFEAYERLH
jgi:hypothetical protein